MPQDHWLPGFNFNVEEWDAKGLTYETLAICRTLGLARAAFAAAVDPQPHEHLEAAPGGGLVSVDNVGFVAVAPRDSVRNKPFWLWSSGFCRSPSDGKR